MKYCFYLLLCTCVLAACNNNPAAESQALVASSGGEGTQPERISVYPIYHGAVVLTQGDRTIFIDPYGGGDRFADFAAPDLVLITHTHSDHLDTATLNRLDLGQATLVAPQAVVDALTDDRFAETRVLANDESFEWKGVNITAVPAYNPPPKDNFHPKGKFNGYVLDFDGERYYFSGDTEGVDEMRALEDIDYAFVAMNLPYTMDVEQAASAVLDFTPRTVYPYHYRNQDGSFSDLEQFRDLVNDGKPDIEVVIEDWYTE